MLHKEEGGGGSSLRVLRIEVPPTDLVSGVRKRCTQFADAILSSTGPVGGGGGGGPMSSQFIYETSDLVHE